MKMKDGDFSASDISSSKVPAAAYSPAVWAVLFVAAAVAAGLTVWRYSRAPAANQADEQNISGISPEEYRPLYALFNEKKYEESRRAAEVLLEKYPNDINALSLMGVSYLREGMETGNAALIEKAGNVFERILVLLPKHIGAISDLATVKRLLGKYDEGIAILERAQRDFPFAQSLETDLAFMKEEAQKAGAR